MRANHTPLKPMKITIISTLQNYWGGSEELWVRIAHEALKNGHQVQCCFFKPSSNLHPKLIEIQAKVHSTVLLEPHKYTSNVLRKIWQTTKNKFKANPYKPIEVFKPDIILINQVHNYSAAFDKPLFQYLTQTSIAYSLMSQFNHDYLTLNNEDREKARICIDKSKLNFYVSHRNFQRTEHQLATKIQAYKIIDNPLNLERIEYITYPKTTTVHFASVARLECNYKRQDILLEILSTAKWKKRDWQLNLYGSGPDEIYLNELIKYYQLQERVVLKGQVKSIESIWKYNHMLLLPSVAEGKPLALEEALICGRPAIVTDVAGNTELINDGVNGFVATSFFKNPFEDAMERAWENKSNWEHMGINGHNKMMASLDLNPEKTVLKCLTELPLHDS